MLDKKTSIWLSVARLLGLLPRRLPPEAHPSMELREASHDLSNSAAHIQGVAERLRKEAAALEQTALDVLARSMQTNGKP